MLNDDLDNSQSIAPAGIAFSQACENNKQPILGRVPNSVYSGS